MRGSCYSQRQCQDGTMNICAFKQCQDEYFSIAKLLFFKTNIKLQQTLQLRSFLMRKMLSSAATTHSSAVDNCKGTSLNRLSELNSRKFGLHNLRIAKIVRKWKCTKLQQLLLCRIGKNI